MSENIFGSGRVSHSVSTYLIKTISCCGKLEIIHYKYAEKFSKTIEYSYEMYTKTYVCDCSIPLLCMECIAHCFYCNKIHLLFSSVNVLVCDLCKRNWSFGVHTSNSRISRKDNMSNDQQPL